MVGMSGNVGLRSGPLTAIARKTPDRICGAADGRLSNIEFDAPAEQVLRRGLRAAIGHVHDIDAAGDFQKLAGEVMQRADAAGAVVQLAGLGFRERDVFLAESATGRSLFTSITSGRRPMMVTWRKSLRGLYGWRSSVALIACEATAVVSQV